MSNTTSDANPISRSGRRMVFAGSLLAGGIALGSLFAPLGLAGAQDDSSTALQSTTDNGANDTTTTDSGTSNRARGAKGAAFAAAPELIEDLLGLTVEEFQAARADGQTLTEIAQSQGVSETDLVASLVEAATNRIATALEEGKIDADRAAMLTGNLETRIAEAVNREPGDRLERDEGAGRRGPGGGAFRAEILADLGLDADEMRTALAAGSTLSEAAALQGVAEADLAAAMTAAAEERLATAVSEGKLDADKAAEIQSGIAGRVQDRLDGVRHEGGAPGTRGDGHGHRRSGPGHGQDETAVDGES